MKYKRAIGIDPGNVGAIAFLNVNKIEMFDMPTIKTEGTTKTKKGNKKIHTSLNETELRNILFKTKPEHVFIEKAQSMPGQGSPATFNYATSYGILRGICVGLQIPYTLIRPNEWKKNLMKSMEKGKQASIIRAQQLYPKANIGKSDGRAEALLILHYGIFFL